MTSDREAFVKLVAWVRGDNEYHERGEATRDEVLASLHAVAMGGACPLNPYGQHSWLPWLQITARSWVTRCVACDRMEQWDV